MIKTIKVKKQFRLEELIKYIRDNRVREKTFRTDEHGNALSNALKVDEDGLIETYFPNMHINNSFTVEVEELITEDTRFKGVQEIYINDEGLIEVEHHPIFGRKSINDVLEEHGEETECLYIYAAVDGETELIYERKEESINA